MPTPILPMASHSSAGSRPTDVAGTPTVQLDAMVGQTNAQEPLNEEDFAYLADALRDPKRAAKATAFIEGRAPNKQGKLISGEESKGLVDYLNAQPPPDLNNRKDSNMLSVGGVGIAPEDVLGAGQVTRGIVGAVKMAPAGAKALAGAGQAALEASPVIKYELTKHGLKAIGVPDAVGIPLAMAVSGYSRGGKAGTGGKAKAEPPSLNDQLGVSPTATGATMDSLPDTPVPAAGRVTVPLAHSSQAAATAAEAARGNADALGVSNAPPLAPEGVLPMPGAPGPEFHGTSREPIPVPQRLRDVTSPRKVSSFEDIAQQLGLDTSKMQAEPAMAASHVPAGAVQTSGQMRGAPAVTMPPDSQMDALQGKMGGLTPPPGLTPSEQSKWVQQELLKELMSRESFRTMGTGSKKRGEGYVRPKGEE